MNTHVHKSGNRDIDEFRLYYQEDAELVGEHDMPRLPKQQHVPYNIVSWSERGSMSDWSAHWFDHFIDDWRFRSVWSALCPNIMLPLGEEETTWYDLDRLVRLWKQTAGIISTDFTAAPELGIDFSRANIRRNAICAYASSRAGIPTIPVASWLDERDFSWCFDSLAAESTVAVSTNGCAETRGRAIFLAGVRELVKQKRPCLLVVCGDKDAEVERICGGDVMFYPPFSRRMRRRVCDGR